MSFAAADHDTGTGADGGLWTQERRLLTIDTVLGEDALLATSIAGQEGISEPFSYEVGLASTDQAIAAERLIGTPVRLGIGTDGAATRIIHGMVVKFGAGPLLGRDFRAYRVEIAPWLRYLDYSTDCRIFQNLSVPDIIEQVFASFGMTDYRFAVARGEYSRLEYCVQYRETALNFLSRLMEEAGLFYVFRHESQRHVLVIADKNVSFETLPETSLVYATTTRRAGHVSRWDHSFRFRSGRWTQRDFNFEAPSTDLTTSESSVLKLTNAAGFERYDYPGRYVEKPLGAKLTRGLMEAEEAGYHAVSGESSYACLTAGGKFSLDSHPCEAENNKLYVLRRVRIDATDLSHLGDAAVAAPSYANSFEAFPYDVPCRVPRTTEKPFVHGPQTAIVVGPAGEKISTDQYGRVRVQFHWDRYGKHDDKSSCWIRVSQAWAGQGWGSVNLPHVGHEVVVSFLEGDPDRPLITGRVYNAERQTTMGMPANKTQSGLKDHSGNEILMEGKAGSQDIRVHAVKDMHVTVDHDREDHVKNDLKYTVDGTSTETITKQTSITITQGNYSHTVATGTATIGVKGKVAETFQDVQETHVTKSITITSATSNILVQAATDITLQVGASKLAMYADGRIELSGKAVGIKGSDTVSISGMSIKEQADNDHSISGAIVMSSGSVSNTVKGAMVMLNP